MIKTQTYLVTILKKYEALLASGVIIIGVVILAVLFLLPNFRTARQIFSQQLILQQQKDRLEKKDEALEEIDHKYFQETYPKMNWILPESKDFVSLFSAFDSLQSKTGVSILRTNFQLGVISTSSAALGRQSSSGAYLVPLSLDVVGGGSDVQKFLASLSDLSGRLITIDEVGWKNQKDGTILARLTGHVYFYPVPGDLGAIETPLSPFDKEKEEILGKIAQISFTPDQAPEIEKIEKGKKNLFQ